VWGEKNTEWRGTLFDGTVEGYTAKNNYAATLHHSQQQQRRGWRFSDSTRYEASLHRTVPRFWGFSPLCNPLSSSSERFLLYYLPIKERAIGAGNE
jgi:hypothetical protein